MGYTEAMSNTNIPIYQYTNIPIYPYSYRSSITNLNGSVISVNEHKNIVKLLLQFPDIYSK